MSETPDAAVPDAPSTDEAPKMGDAPQEQPKGQEPEGKTFTAEYVQQLRQEAKDYRTQLKTVKDQLTQIETARVEALEKAGERIRTLATQSEIALLAAQNGVTNVKRLSQMVKDDVQYDDNGAPTNLEELVKAAIADIPGLVAAGKPQVPQPGAGINPPRTPPGKPQVDPRSVRLSTPGIFDME